MKFALFSLVLALGSITQAACKNVFAHVVVGDTAAHTQTTWANDISLAAAAGIDAFVLNIGHGDTNIPTQVANAFAAAEAAGSSFKLFFSFDYLGGGSVWPATGDSSVASYLNQYKNSAAYFHYNGVPFVSTFEGTSNIGDWAQGGVIRSAVGGVYFVPDWTSLGPSGIAPYLNNIEGFFSWDMWPNGAVDKTDDSDKAWQAAIGSGKSYMMGVSPWFFHSPSGGKDWVWRGDDLWSNRWQQTLDVNPEFVQIVSWNDFAEAHYIGPIYTQNEVATGSWNYVQNMPHESLRDFLPFYIARFKSILILPRDQMQYWYRVSPAASGPACGVVGNNADQGQTEIDPNSVEQDKIFFSALLTSAAEVHVQVGTNPVVVYQGVQGVNHWSQPFNGQFGSPVFSVVRNGVIFGSSTNGAGTPAIVNGPTTPNGCTNYNFWAGSW